MTARPTAKRVMIGVCYGAKRDARYVDIQNASGGCSLLNYYRAVVCLATVAFQQI